MRSSVQIAATLLVFATSCPLWAAETNVEIASRWWTELTNVVTPVGWQDHPHRFCVIYDGTVLALPRPRQLLQFERGAREPVAGVQLGFTPSADAMIPPERNEPFWLALPDGRRVGDQGWLDQPAPVLWTRWRPAKGKQPGQTLRQLLFAHMAGGGEAHSGEEPMFAWIRLEAAGLAPRVSKARRGFMIKISAPHIRFAMNERANCRVLPEASAYSKPLRLEPIKRPPGGEFSQGTLLLEGDGAVRLAVLAGEGSSVKLVPATEGRRDDYLHLMFPATADAHLDLLLPMVPTSRPAIQDELALGYDSALAEANRFWAACPPTAASIHTPEPLINAAIADSVRLARMITETVPCTRQRALLSGAMFYSYLWVTPVCMTKHMLLDPLGWHDEVAKYLEIYRQQQGRVTPPGPDFRPHPGYFGAPDVLSSGNQWLTDHGSVLYTVSRHALLSGDQAFVDRWLDPVLRACDFIVEARRLPRAGAAAEGVMPPASASDVSRPIQAFWSDAWNYKALVTAARLLRVLDHGRADALEQEAAEYGDALARALRAKAARQPRWTDRFGRQRAMVPMTITTDDTDGLGHEHPFYLDTGPIFGVYAGVLPGDDPLMRDAVDFLREGPHTCDGGARRTWNDPPRLIHEMSSAEPCYSWNIFHSRELADRQRYLEGLYSLFTGALSRQTHVSCETRGGITENVFASTLAVNLARLAVVDDEVEPQSLHLLRLTPLAWVSAAEHTRFENMPTEFGPVTLKWRLSGDGHALHVEYVPRFRRMPEAVLLHVPPVPQLTEVVVNGQVHEVEARRPIRL